MRKKRGERVLGPYHEVDGTSDWYRIVEIDAQGKRFASKFPSEKEAERYKEILTADLERDDHTTASALVAYREHLKAKGNKPDSIRQTMSLIEGVFHADVHLRDLTTRKAEAMYERYRTTPLKRTQKPPSVDTHRSALIQSRSFISWCIEKGWLRDNPFDDVKGIGKRRHRGKSLGANGTELRIRDARQWYGMAVFKAHRDDEGATAALVACLLGMRASEITTRETTDLDEDQAPGDLLWIPCSKTPAGRRTLEVPEVLRPYLVACAANKPSTPDAPKRYLFEVAPGKPHWRDWVRDQVHRICDLAEVPRVTAHAMRGLLATITTERGLAGHVVAATLGHEDVRTTMTSYAAPGSAAAGVRRRGLKVLDGGAKPAK